MRVRNLKEPKICLKNQKKRENLNQFQLTTRLSKRNKETNLRERKRRSHLKTLRVKRRKSLQKIKQSANLATIELSLEEGARELVNTLKTLHKINHNIKMESISLKERIRKRSSRRGTINRLRATNSQKAQLTL
jgi:hypothetical protein